jgi:hypothetical protein
MFYPDLLFWLSVDRQAADSERGKPPVVSDAKRAMITKRITHKCDAIDASPRPDNNPRACQFESISSALR